MLIGHLGVWRSLVARVVRDDEAAGSNPVTPTHPLRGRRWRPLSAFRALPGGARPAVAGLRRGSQVAQLSSADAQGSAAAGPPPPVGPAAVGPAISPCDVAGRQSLSCSCSPCPSR